VLAAKNTERIIGNLIFAGGDNSDDTTTNNEDVVEKPKQKRRKKKSSAKNSDSSLRDQLADSHSSLRDYFPDPALKNYLQGLYVSSLFIRTYAEEENCEAIFRRSGSEFIILRIPMPENLRFHDRKSAVLVLDVPWRQHFFFTREYTKYTAGFTFCFVVGVVVIESL
jgi:hypothetical protein